MDKHHILAVPIALMVWILTIFVFIKFMYDARVEIEAHYLNVATNYAVDAAVQEMLYKSTNLNNDYIDVVYAEVSPEIALEEFCRMMCENLGYADTEENREVIKNAYLDGFMVVAFDGYYEANPVRRKDAYGNSYWDWNFKPKRAFTVDDGHNVYVLNLGLQDAKVFDSTGLRTVPLSSIESIVQSHNSDTRANTAKSIINSMVSDAFTKSVYENTNTLTKAYNLPVAASHTANTNPIEGITVLAHVSGVRSSMDANCSAFSVGGAKLTQSNFVAAYVRDGVKYYIEVGRLTPAVRSKYAIASEIKVFLNPKEAAENGYSYDLIVRENK